MNQFLHLNDMEHHIIFLKLIIIPMLTAISVELIPVADFAIMFYCTATLGVIYTIILPYYRKKKSHKKWVKDGCKKEDRYKWEDIQ